MNVLNKFRASHETRMLLWSLAAGAPAVAVALWLLWTGGYGSMVRWSASIVIVGAWWWGAVTVRDRVAIPLRTVSNLLEALREGDYSMRGRSLATSADGKAATPVLDVDALSGVMHQVNAMAATLRAQRLGALEATALLRKVMEEIDVAVFAFDGDQRLRLVNRAGERVLGKPSERTLGASATELGLHEYLAGPGTRTVNRNGIAGGTPATAGAPGRWSVTRSGFREGGLPHQLLVVSDLTRALREEELQAWQRLVRVLGHELNNSLAPIKSIAGSLETLVARETLPEDWRDDARRGLAIIASRSDGLARFVGSYAKLAALPQPQMLPIHVGEWVRQTANLEQRVTVEIDAGPEVTIRGDRTQLEQVLINLLRNAAEATLEITAGETKVRLGWTIGNGHVEVVVLDEGPGLSNTANLFVPYFTTKPGGSGIGLVLSRQIVETHGGSLELRNRTDRRGCIARLTLPA